MGGGTPTVVRPVAGTLVAPSSFAPISDPSPYFQSSGTRSSRDGDLCGPIPSPPPSPSNCLLQGANEPDRVAVPEDTIFAIPDCDENNELPEQLIESLRGQVKRDWLVSHAYRCLPLVMGSQHGFIVKALYDFTLRWNGGPNPEDTLIDARESDPILLGEQLITSRFGLGIVTVQNRWTIRTPRNVNTITVAPPNYWIDGIAHLVGVVETDNLRRDFTFNLKLTRPNHDIAILKGTPIGCMLPYPRHFIDRFQLKNAVGVLPPDIIATERRTAERFGVEREMHDIYNPHGIGRRYWDGKDAYGNKFSDHQTKLDSDDTDP